MSLKREKSRKRAFKDEWRKMLQCATLDLPFSVGQGRVPNLPVRLSQRFKTDRTRPRETAQRKLKSLRVVRKLQRHRQSPGPSTAASPRSRRQPLAALVLFALCISSILRSTHGADCVLTNIALNRPVTVSSDYYTGKYDSSGSGLVPAFTTGVPGDGWHAANNDNQNFLILDLGQEFSAIENMVTMKFSGSDNWGWKRVTIEIKSGSRSSWQTLRTDSTSYRNACQLDTWTLVRDGASPHGGSNFSCQTDAGVTTHIENQTRGCHG